MDCDDQIPVDRQEVAWLDEAARPLQRMSCALGAPDDWFDAAHVRDVKGAAAVLRDINDSIEYLYADEFARVNYGRRRRDRLPISTAFVESAVNEILEIATVPFTGA